MEDRPLTNEGGNTVTKKRSVNPVVAEPQSKGAGAGEREFVRAFVLKLVGDPSLADDLVQETLLRAHKSTGFKGDASRRTWLCAIALNLMRDHFRATARRPKQVSDPEVLLALPSEEALEDDLLQREMDSCIRQYVLRIPERQRDVVALHDFAGLTHREVAAALGISVSNSRVLLHRGRAALKLLLEENCVLCFDESIPCQPKAG
jgi:RNA polymerase sigma-70 factor (ECF subfamily)